MLGALGEARALAKGDHAHVRGWLYGEVDRLDAESFGQGDKHARRRRARAALVLGERLLGDDPTHRGGQLVERQAARGSKGLEACCVRADGPRKSARVVDRCYDHSISCQPRAATGVPRTLSSFASGDAWGIIDVRTTEHAQGGANGSSAEPRRRGTARAATAGSHRFPSRLSRPAAGEDGLSSPQRAAPRPQRGLQGRRRRQRQSPRRAHARPEARAPR